MVFNRENAILIGGYDKRYYPSADYYFNYKYIEKYGGININKKLVKYRMLVNESLKIDNLKSFITLDYGLRKEIFQKQFKGNKRVIYFSSILNSIQACSQIARYVFIRSCKIDDFYELEIGFNNKFKNFLIKNLLVSKHICIFFELIILFSWRIIFLLKK